MTALMESLAESGSPVLPDEVPPFDGEPEFACEVCGTPLVYGGRGRKPKRCDEHKRSGGSRTTKIPAGSNDKLAGMAADVLCQLNGFLGMGLMLGKMNRTAGDLAAREDAFRMQAYEALKADPALCKSILKAGATSAKMSLVLAYGLLFTAIAPTAIEEIREIRAEKAASNEAVSEDSA